MNDIAVFRGFVCGRCCIVVFCNTAAGDLPAASCVALDRVPSGFIHLNNDADVIKRLSQP